MRRGEDGDELSFVEFATSRTPALLRLARLLTGAHDEAEDLVQESLIRAHHRWALVAGANSPDAYMRRVLVNQFHSGHRQQRVNTGSLERAEAVHHLQAPAQLGWEERDGIRRAIASLPVRQRTVLVLRYYEDLDISEIAASMGVEHPQLPLACDRRGQTGHGRRRARPRLHPSSPTEAPTMTDDVRTVRKLRAVLLEDAEDLAPGAVDRVLAATLHRTTLQGATQEQATTRQSEHRLGRRWLPALAGTTVILVVAMTWAWLGHVETGHEPPPTQSSDPVVAPAGTRLVGLGRAVVAVPSSWATQDVNCEGQPLADTVFGAEDGWVCQDGTPAESEADPSWLEILSADSPEAKRYLADLAPAGSVSGSVVEEGPACPSTPDPSCQTVFAVPKESAVFVLQISAPDEPSLAHQIRSSLKILPTDYTTVPFVPLPAYDDVPTLMTAAGVTTRNEPAPASAVPPGAVPESYLYSEPAAGTPVRRGTQVVLRVVPGSLSSLPNDQYPDASDIQGSWTMVMSGLDANGQPGLNRHLDMHMTMKITGNRFDAYDGCQEFTGSFTLVNQAFRVTAIQPGATIPCSDQPPVQELLQAARHATTHKNQFYLHAANYGILLSFTRTA